jgi:hypothetical protein
MPYSKIAKYLLMAVKLNSSNIHLLDLFSLPVKKYNYKKKTHRKTTANILELVSNLLYLNTWPREDTLERKNTRFRL